jgi:hypothetical protein
MFHRAAFGDPSGKPAIDMGGFKSHILQGGST